MNRTIASIVAAVSTALAVLLGASLSAQLSRPVIGIVTDDDSGRPVAGAHVEYEHEDDVEKTVTDSRGAFEFSEATAGTLGVVTVSENGYATAHRRWPPVSGRTLEIGLFPPATVGGTVADMASGTPLPADVHIVVEHDHALVSDSTVADRRGEFLFEDLPTGQAAVIAVVEGYAPGFDRLTLAKNEHAASRIRLLLQAGVSGHVVDGSGNPVVGAEIVAWYGGDDDPPDGAETLESYIGGRRVTGEEGDFSANQIVPDRPVMLQAILDGKESDVVTVVIAPGSILEGVVLRIG